MRELPTSPGDLIRARLADLGWTHVDLSEVIGMKRAEVTRLISGGARFTARNASRFAAALSIEPIAILHAQSLVDLSGERGWPQIRERAVVKARQSADRARAMVRACDSICAPESEAAE